MSALTEMLDKPIRDPNGEAFGRLHDLVVRVGQRDGTALPASEKYPLVTGLVARLRGPHGAARDVFIPWDQVKRLDADGADLTTPGVNLRRFERREGEIVLREGLFDRQVVDVEGRRVVRINDVDLTQHDGTWRLVGVDVSPGGLLRRAGFQRLSKRINQAPIIDWAQVVPVVKDGQGSTLRLRVTRERLDLMRPADLARVVEQLSPQQGADLLEGMDEARAADAIEELENEQQGQILRAMDPERAADVLEEMEPDEATDALQNVTEEEAADILGRMNREEANEVQELLGYPEDSAGGIMTTEYVSVPSWATAGEVIGAMRAQARAAAAGEDDPLPDALQEIFVVAVEDATPLPLAARQSSHGARARTRRQTPLPIPRAMSLEAEGHLVGLVTLRDLLLADPEARLLEISHKPRSVAHPLEDQRDAARLIADEDMIALPVVDEKDMLLGIITVDDAIDVILPTAWKKRIPRIFR